MDALKQGDGLQGGCDLLKRQKFRIYLFKIWRDVDVCGDDGEF
jgi:hypothetical protein